MKGQLPTKILCNSFLIRPLEAIHSEHMTTPTNKSQINKINIFFTSMPETEKADVLVAKKNCFLEGRDSNLSHVKGYSDHEILSRV
jgi:hypothetical protein